jgi:hypothetical protein
MGNQPSILQNMVNQTIAKPPQPVVTPAKPKTTQELPPGPPAGYDSSMDQGSWYIYSELQTTKEMAGLQLDSYNSFCKTNAASSQDLNTKCSNLTEYNCKRVGCCVFTSNNTCEAGGANGATYSPNLDYYYYQNKCYGSKCPP